MNLNIKVKDDLTAREASIIGRVLGGHFEYNSKSGHLDFVARECMQASLKRVMFSDAVATASDTTFTAFVPKQLTGAAQGD